MTVTNTTPRADYVGNGATSAYDFDFPVASTSEITVYKTDTAGAVTPLYLSTGFTAVLNADGSGTITLVAGNLTVDYLLAIVRASVLDQQTDFTARTVVTTANAQTSADRLARQVQEVNEKHKGSIRIHPSEDPEDFSMVLPALADRALRTLGFDSDGNVMAGVSIGEASVSAYGETLIDDADAATARSTLGIANIGALDSIATRTVIGRTAGGTGAPSAISPDDVSVLADGGTAARDLSLRAIDEINPLDFGVIGDGTTNDTTAIQALLDANAASGKLLKFPSRTYKVSQITLTGLGCNIDFNNATFVGSATTATNSLMQIKCGLSVIKGIRVALQQNQNYTCGVHWYTNDLNEHSPGRNRIDGLFVTEALIGLVIGALPAQAGPIPAQGTVNADGTASDAPLSECYIHGLKTPDCIRGVYMRQPNGKMCFVAPDIATEHLSWSSPPSLSNCCALSVVDPGSELIVLGGNVEALQSTAAGQLFQVTDGQLLMEGVCIESAMPGYIAGTGMVRIDKVINWGSNSTTQVMVEVDDGATGILQITDSRLFMADAFATGTVSWLKCTSSLGGSFSPAASFRVEAKGVEFYNAPFTWPTPIVNGCDVSFVNCSRSTYTGTTRDTLRKLHDATDRLTDVCDVSVDQVLAHPDATSVTSAGWTSTVGGAGSTWGKYATGLPTIEHDAPNAAMRLTTTGNTMIVRTAVFPFPKGKDLIFRAWMKSGSTTNAIIVRVEWFKYDGTTAASTASVDALTGQESAQIGATWRPVILRLQPPIDAVKAKVFLYAETGADLQVLNPSLK